MNLATVRQAAIWATRRSGLEVRRKPAALIRSPHECYFNPELAAADLSWNAIDEQRTVVQIGAFDAAANDPVSNIIRRFGWRGVLVEPQPGPFSRAAALHEDSDDVKLYNVAISDSIGERTLYTVAADAGLPDWTQQTASFDLEHVRRQQKHVPAGADLIGNITPITVQAWTFEKLLTEAAVTRVDMLQIDTEGYDYEVLRMFDFERWQPAIVNYEHAHLSRDSANKAAELLISHGYQLSMTFVVGSGDTLAYRPEG